MIKITHVPEVTYCHIQRTTASAKVYRTTAYEWEGQTHKFYDVILRDDYSIVCQDNGLFIITSPGRNYITLYPEDFQEIIFK